MYIYIQTIIPRELVLNERWCCCFLLRRSQTTQERQTATIVRLERELEEARHKLDETKMEVQAVQNSHRAEIKKMQDLLKMMQEQLEALQANRSGPVPTKVCLRAAVSAELA